MNREGGGGWGELSKKNRGGEIGMVLEGYV